MQEQIPYAYRDLRLSPVPLSLGLLDQAEQFHLYRIEADPVIVEDILPFRPDILHQITVYRRILHHMA